MRATLAVRHEPRTSGGSRTYSQMAYMFLKARKVLHKQSLANLYYSFIYPYLIFCNHVWGNACKSHMHKLLLLQKKIVRIIAGVQPRCHTDPLFSQMKLLKADQIHKYLIGRLMFKVYHRDLDIFQDYFTLNSDIHDHSTQQTDHYHVPFYRTEMRKHCLRYCGAEIWNKILVKKIDITCSEYVFSRELKNKILVGQVWLFPCTVNMIKKKTVLNSCMLSLLLSFWFFSYKFYLISSTYSHHPEMFIILLQPLHPLVIHFDYISCNRFGAHKLIRVSSPLCNCPEWLHFDGLVLDCRGSIANALELLQSCTARPSTWCPPCFIPVL